MISLVHVAAPSNAGPGDRHEALIKARQFLTNAGVDAGAVVRIDVPGRGGGEEGSGAMRVELESLVPMLQSGSIFGGLQGLELIDAHNLNAAEGALLAELLPHADPGAVAIALVSFGSLPASLSKAVKAVAEVVTMKKQYERQAGDWLADEIRRRGTEIDASGTAALQQRFGSDTAAMGQALDQLAAFPGKISRDVVLARFRNRPDEPTFHYTDAVAAGRVGEALRRLADFLTHSHPLILVAALETDLRRRALAAAAPDQQTFYKWIGATASDRRPERLWRDRGKVADSSLRKALDALVRADRILKTQPEDLHQVTLERLTVALARWYGK